MLEQLFERARSGDQSAERDLYDHLFVRFTTIAKRRIGEDAEDIAQDACLTVLQKYRDETYYKGFEPWAHGVLRMKIGNYLRGPMRKKKAQIGEYDDQFPGAGAQKPFDPTLRQDLLSCLRKIIKRNVTYARVLNLSHLGYKTEDVCQRLGITPNNAYVILNRGRRMLKKCLSSGVV